MDILIVSLHPNGDEGNEVGDLRAAKSKYGKCWVIHGSHPLLRTFPMSRFSRCVAHIYKIVINPNFFPKLWEADGLGVTPSKNCIRCQKCASAQLLFIPRYSKKSWKS